jgi:hypothetical protein
MKFIRHYNTVLPKAIARDQDYLFLWYPGPKTIPHQQHKYVLRSSQHIKMKYATIESVMASFPHPLLPIVQGELDYQKNHATRKLLQANLRAIETHLGDGTLGHLGLIISDASYAMISPTTDAGPTLWTTPQAPGRAPAATDGTAAQISVACHI